MVRTIKPASHRAAGTALSFAIFAGAVIGGITLVCERPILLAVGTPVDILPGALVYARVAFATLPILFAFMICYTSLLRGLGDSRTPLVTLAIAEVIFIGSTPLFILGLWGLPKLGIAGMPVANAVAMSIALVVQWIWLALREGVRISFARVVSHLWPDRVLLVKLVRIGDPDSRRADDGCFAR